MSLDFTHVTLGQRVLFGTGQAAEHVTAEVARLGAKQVMVIAGAALLLFIPLSSAHKSLDMLLLDESTSQALGLSVSAVRLAVLLPASIATAICVSYFGVIGFIGLMAPHVSRLLVGPKHKHLLLPSALHFHAGQ